MTTSTTKIAPSRKGRKGTTSKPTATAPTASPRYVVPPPPAETYYRSSSSFDREPRDKLNATGAALHAAREAYRVEIRKTVLGYLLGTHDLDATAEVRSHLEDVEPEIMATLARIRRLVKVEPLEEGLAELYGDDDSSHGRLMAGFTAIAECAWRRRFELGITEGAEEFWSKEETARHVRTFLLRRVDHVATELCSEMLDVLKQRRDRGAGHRFGEARYRASAPPPSTPAKGQG